MKENFEFTGRHYDPEEREEASEARKKWNVEALEPIDGELEKTEEQKRMLNIVQTMLRSEFEYLDIELDASFFQNIRILPDAVFRILQPRAGNDGKAVFDSFTNTIYISNEMMQTKAEFVITVLHELVHKAQTLKFFVSQGNDVRKARLGYSIESPWKKTDRQEVLNGFSEIMTEYTAHKIMLENKELLQDELGITENEILTYSNYGYLHLIDIIDPIIDKIAEDKGISTNKVFKELEEGQFGKNILNLKDVERSFGKGSLRILGMLGHFTKENQSLSEELIAKFFAEKDETTRKKLKAEIEELFKKTTDEYEYEDEIKGE